MKNVCRVFVFVLAIAMIASVLAACGGDGGAKDAFAGTWKQTDEINGDWVWTFDGSGKCTLVGETTGFSGEGAYKLDESAKTATVKIEAWDDEKVYTYTLTDTTLDLVSTYSTYHLVKQ